jgi:outer membrane protein assembly factor BamD
MSRRIPLLALLGLLLAIAAGCTNKKVNNPLANVGSKQPDKVLFDRAMDQMKHNKFDQARMILQTLINTYPDSEFIARAKLAVADSWYAEGGTTALAQAELEYKDFETFFPNMPEAAEAQLKIANIHYQQMEKPDRDYTHAMRAEDEYRQLIMQYPDSKLVPEAKQRLMEVQEVLGHREFIIGRFYYLRQSYAAAIARLKSVVDRYPLYSQADEALYLLGQAYEGQINNLRAAKMQEAAKAKVIQEFTKNAADAYSKILTRYPVMNRAEDAKKRLAALHQPIPQATKEAIALNQKEEDSRRSSGMFGRLMGNFTRHPDVAAATKVGDPALVTPKPYSATDVVKEANVALMGSSAAGSDHKVAVETVKGVGAPPPGEATPRSDAPPAPAGADTASPAPAANPASDATTDTGANASTAAPPADPNANAVPELKPNVDDGNGGQPLPPPTQVNELQQGTQPDPAAKPADAAPAAANTGSNADQGSSSNTASSSSSNHKDDGPNVSSSKKKKKHKLIPF